MADIRLGDKVRCKYSGFTGVAVAKAEFINGCVQFEVLPKVDKDGKSVDPISIDSQSLEVIGSVTKPKKSSTGGPSKPSTKMRGY